MNKKNNYNSESNEIDLKETIKLIWKDKILVLFITIVFGLLASLYNFTTNKEFYSNVVLNEPPINLFRKYDNLFKTEAGYFSRQLQNKFYLNLLSIDNLNYFLSQSKIKNEHSKKIKFLAKDFTIVEKKFSSKNEFDKNVLNQYFLFFPEGVEGDILLSSYIEFTLNKSLVEIKNFLKKDIEELLIEYNLNLNIAYELNILNPIFDFYSFEQKLKEEKLITSYALSTPIFARGTKLINQDILLLKNLLKDVDKNSFNYNHIYQAISKIKVKESLGAHVYLLVGLTVGFFLSLMIVFFKNFLKRE